MIALATSLPSSVGAPPSSYIVAVGSERGQGTGSSSSSDSSDSDELLDEVEEEGGLGELTKSDSTSLNTDSHHRLPCYPVGTARCPPRTRRGPERNRAQKPCPPAIDLLTQTGQHRTLVNPVCNAMNAHQSGETAEVVAGEV